MHCSFLSRNIILLGYPIIMYYFTESIILSLKLVNIKDAVTDGHVLYKNIFKSWKILRDEERERCINFNFNLMYTYKNYIEPSKYL